MVDGKRYVQTNTRTFSVNEWLEMLQDGDCFTPALIEAIYTLVYEMDGEGSAKQISKITGRAFQAYNSSLLPTVRRLRNKGYNFTSDIREYEGTERYWSQFFNGYYDNDGSFIWVLKDNLNMAFKEYNRINQESVGVNDGEVVSSENETTEGMRRLRIHFKIERNSEIVNDAKRDFINKNGSLYCEACNFSFKKTYDIDYIEAHHVLPLYKGKRVTKKTDLMMLCANCHRAIHSSKWNETNIDLFIEHMQVNAV